MTALATRVARLAARLAADPARAPAALATLIEDRLIRRRARRSLRRLNIPREPYDDIAREVMAIHWFHRIALPDGRVTPGDNDSAWYARRLKLPESFVGKTVLDV